MLQLAVIYVNLVKLDNCGELNQRAWPTAIQDSIALVTSQADENQGQLYYRFMLRIQLALDEECIERAEQKSMKELHIATQVKDAMRVSDVAQLSQLFVSVLQSYQRLEGKVVKNTLRVCAKLIDWNELALFSPLVDYFKHFLGTEFRA